MLSQEHSDATSVDTSWSKPEQVKDSPKRASITKTPLPLKLPVATKGTSRDEALIDAKQSNTPSTFAAWFKTYRAGFVNACVLLPTITALFTIFFYFLIPTIPWLPNNRLSVLISGVLLAFFAMVLVAFFRCSAATYEEGNVQSYSNSEINLNFLETRLTIMKQFRENPPEHETAEDVLLRNVGLTEAENALQKAKRIRETCNGYHWITGAGYAYLSQALHQAEEAFIKMEPVFMLISEAKHDQAALQDANISNNTEMFEQLRQAIEDLDSHYKQPKQHNDFVEFWREKLLLLLTSDEKVAIQPHHQEPAHSRASLAERERQARVTIFFVRHTLNDYRVNRLFELVQQRSNLVLAITVTGVITYILICLALLSPLSDLATIFQAATAYFFVGAAAGLFGRLYSVSTEERMTNSYGLPTARTNAAAHLSGIAGVGGVFVIQALLQVANFSYPGHAIQPFAFSLPNLLIAATFGLTPNLLITNLQKQAQQTISDLESTKTSVVGKNGSS